MPAKSGAWGIDIGQAGLKAIRLEINEATDQVQATAFDYIAHPKILSQPDAIPEELISQALGKFLKQNDIGNDLVAISVPGQSALAAFHSVAPGRVEQSQRDRQIRGTAADPLRPGRRSLGLPDVGQRDGRERLFAGGGGRPVRYEARPGHQPAQALHECRSRDRTDPDRAPRRLTTF